MEDVKVNQEQSMVAGEKVKIEEKELSEQEKAQLAIRDMVMRLSAKQRRALFDKLEKQHLKGTMMWDSRNGTYRKNVHGKLVTEYEQTKR